MRFSIAWKVVLTIASFMVLLHYVSCTNPVGQLNNSKSLVRDISKGLAWARFVKNEKRYLNVSEKQTLSVSRLGQCALNCVKTFTSFSFNFGIRSNADGNHTCEVLSTDRYNESDKYKSSVDFHHFSIYSPCSDEPCQNGATCLAMYDKDEYKCACLFGFYGRRCATARECSALYSSGQRRNGVYTVDPDGRGAIQVYCDMTTDGGGWTVFQRRQDGSVDFYRTWNQYKTGFGNLNGEFWLGNDYIHQLTAWTVSTLRVELEDWYGNKKYAKYGSFSVGDEGSKYILSVSSHSGSVRDSLSLGNSLAFSTKDRDNDLSPHHCAVKWTGAWWYNRGSECTDINLNGQYLGNRNDNRGIKWWFFKTNDLSLKFTEMKLRRQSF